MDCGECPHFSGWHPDSPRDPDWCGAAKRELDPALLRLSQLPDWCPLTQDPFAVDLSELEQPDLERLSIAVDRALSRGEGS
jgi:hypothetical protein